MTLLRRLATLGLLVLAAGGPARAARFDPVTPTQITTVAPTTSAQNDNKPDTTANSQNRLSRVANAATLASWVNYAFPVERDDVPGVKWADTGASCTSADGFAQVQPAAGHCWQLLKGTRYSLRIWGAAENGDIGAALTAAFAYLQNLGGAQELIDDIPNAVVASANRIYQPTGVTLRGQGNFSFSDVTNLSSITFSSASGGLTAAPGSAIANLNLIGGSATDHLIEQQGQLDVSNLRCGFYVSCVRATNKITTGLSSANTTSANTGLAAGTYSGIAFTGGGGSGATLSITVNSSGIITGTSFTTNGTGYSPWFDYGFAANAVYSGSPAVAVAGQVATAGEGRSSYRSNFFISYGTGSSATGIALECDGAYDFVDMDNNEVWSPSGIGQSTVTAFKLGHIDGLSMKNPKVFGISKAIEWSAPTTGIQSFGSIVGAQFDGVTTGVNLTFPLAQLSITGGYTRALAKPMFVNSPTVQLAVSGHAYYTLSDNIQFYDFAQLNFVGNTLSTNALGGGGFTEIYVGAGSGTPVGAGNGYIGGNTFDGRVPALAVDTSAKGITVGPNRWPGRLYSGGTGFLSNGSATTTILPMTGGQVTLTTDANGKVTIPYNIGFSPQQPTASTIGASAAGGYRAAIVSTGTESMSVQILTAAGAAAASGISVTLAWGA